MPVVTFTLNGSAVSIDADNEDALLWILRDRMGVTGPKYGCGVGVCGACTSHVTGYSDGLARRPCITPMGELEGRTVTTIEGLAVGDVLTPVQQAWVDEDVSQCGYCQAGQIMRASALLAENPNPSDADIDEAMKDNVCRCGTYFRIRTAIKRAAGTSVPPEVVRVGGENRLDTAALLSAATFQPGVAIAFIATSAAFPDALAGGPAAAANRGPVLLTEPTRLTDVTAAELQRLQPGRIIVLGGPQAVADNVVAQLSEFTSGSVDRIGGDSRFDTAALLSEATFAAAVAVAYVATGAAFPDALAGGAAAGRDAGPMLLVQVDAVPAATRQELQRLAPERIVVLGGAAAVSDAVVAELDAIAPTERIAGASRFETAGAVARTWDAATTVFVATGADFPDALAGVPAAVAAGSPVLLVEPGSLPAATTSQLQRLSPRRVVVLGGPLAVAEQVMTAISQAIGAVR